jgi:hypothetical protein
VCFQDRVPGTDVRVYVVDGEVVASIAIATDAVDFRGNEIAMSALPLDDRLRDICVRATAVLGLRFTGMDLELDRHARGDQVPTATLAPPARAASLLRLTDTSLDTPGSCIVTP